jgi:hypothetical protein
MNDKNRVQDSIKLVKNIIHQVSTQYETVDNETLHKDGVVYKVLVEYKAKTRTLGAFTMGEIVNCTDPKTETATKYQTYIKICVQQDIKNLIVTQ